MSILSCNICKEIYNEKNKRPLSLPCGNIYCEECIKNLYNFQTKSFLCPNHKIYHQFKLNNIPICAQVYEYLKDSTISNEIKLKAISKICDSFRASDKDKNLVKQLRYNLRGIGVNL